LATATGSDCKLGLLAFGDSITNGGGELQWGVALQSWALWVARATGLGFTSYATDGARAGDVVHLQIPAFERVHARPRGFYELGCLYIGVNDVRAVDWDVSTFEVDYRAALRFLLRRCDRVLTATAPLNLGRPRVRVEVRALNAVIEAVAGELGALVLDLRDFGARNLLMPDHVHPTAFGQIAIAERALSVLSGDGLRVAVRPSSLILYETSWLGRLRGDLTYAYRSLKMAGRGPALEARTAARAWLGGKVGAARWPGGRGRRAKTSGSTRPKTQP
jgi:lysophospholipase L1-like esterase